MPNNCKVKGILKGMRFMSQVFDSEKEKEIEIGYPTDVKHVAHIGWQGHSAENNPSWMNEFKSSPGLTTSAPLSLYGNDNSAQCVSEDSDSAVKRGSRSMNGEERDARSSRKQSMRESHAKEKSDRPRNPKTRSSKSKESSSCNNNNKNNESTNNNSKCSSEQPPPIQIQQQIQGCSSEHQPPRNNLLPDVSKGTSSIKVKDATGSTATKSSRSSRAQHHHHRDHNLNREISSRSGHHKARNKHSRHLEEDQSESEQDQDQNGHQLQRGSGKILLTN